MKGGMEGNMEARKDRGKEGRKGHVGCSAKQRAYRHRPFMKGCPV